MLSLPTQHWIGGESKTQVHLTHHHSLPRDLAREVAADLFHRQPSWICFSFMYEDLFLNEYMSSDAVGTSSKMVSFVKLVVFAAACAG